MLCMDGVQQWTKWTSVLVELMFEQGETDDQQEAQQTNKLFRMFGDKCSGGKKLKVE